MTFWNSILLGVIQGITEFMPVSSTMHVNFVAQLCNITEDISDFTVLLNIGTIFAVCLFYKKEVLKLIIGFWDFFSFKRSENRRLFLLILLGNIPVLIVGFIVHFFKVEFDHLSIFGVSMILIASIILYLCDKKKICRNLVTNNAIHCFAVGCVQIFALFPGVSRLGSTLCAIRFLGYSRQEAFRFSMILSLLPISGACFLKFIGMIEKNSDFNVINNVIPICVCFLFGLITISIFDKKIEKITFKPFVIYRILFALIIFCLFCI